LQARFHFVSSFLFVPAFSSGGSIHEFVRATPGSAAGQGNRILIGLFSRQNSFQDIVTPGFPHISSVISSLFQPR